MDQIARGVGEIDLERHLPERMGGAGDADHRPGSYLDVVEQASLTLRRRGYCSATEPDSFNSSPVLLGRGDDEVAKVT